MQTFVATRGIPSLLHFTRLANLPAILANGIVPRHTLIEGGVPFEHNDEIRLDGHQDASCFTIGWPNYKMFYTARCNNPGVKWAVIECSSSILWEKDCIFSAENAASGTARAVPDVVRRGVPGISAMYAETIGKPTRARWACPPTFPRIRKPRSWCLAWLSHVTFCTCISTTGSHVRHSQPRTRRYHSGAAGKDRAPIINTGDNF